MKRHLWWIFLLGAALGQTAKDLQGLGPEEAMALAKRWRQAGVQAVSYLTQEAVVFEVGGSRVAIPLPKDRMALAIAPYRTLTHPCTIHYFSSCRGELVGERFRVRVYREGKLLLDKEVEAGPDGFFELWLPRNGRFTVEIQQGTWVAQGSVATFKDSPTCLTGFRLAAR